MQKIIFIMYLYLYILYILIIIFINYSAYVYIHLYILTLHTYICYLNLWFIFFMVLIFFFLIFLLTKKIINTNKYLYTIYGYLLILNIVIYITIIEDFIYFIILFESLFFPICFISLLFNFNNRFIFAIYYLIIFSSISSILCIIILIIIIIFFNTFNFQNYFNLNFFDSLKLSIFIWCLLFIIFAIKYPIWPLHIWLPEVHVEVSTEMSALLASIVLKIGFFGVYKYIFLGLNYISIWFLGITDTIIVLGLIFLAINLLFLVDYKKIIAHWSVIHTGIGLILLWHNDLLFTSILFFCNIGHILSSALMFILIGYMYDNYGIRIFLIMISFFGLSIWGNLFLSLFLFNIDFPFMLLFYIDILVLYGLLSLSFLYTLIFLIIILLVFISSIYIYISLNYFSFIWLDKFIRLDILINDIYIYVIIATLTCTLFYVLQILF